MHLARAARLPSRSTPLGRTLRCGLFLVLPNRAFSLVVPTTIVANAVGTSLPAVWTAYSSALVLYPLETKVATAAVLAVGGDAIAQRRGGEKYDVSRASSFVLFDAAYRGGFQVARQPTRPAPASPHPHAPRTPIPAPTPTVHHALSSTRPSRGSSSTAAARRSPDLSPASPAIWSTRRCSRRWSAPPSTSYSSFRSCTTRSSSASPARQPHVNCRPGSAGRMPRLGWSTEMLP